MALAWILVQVGQTIESLHLLLQTVPLASHQVLELLKEVNIVKSLSASTKELELTLAVEFPPASAA